MKLMWYAVITFITKQRLFMHVKNYVVIRLNSSFLTFSDVRLPRNEYKFESLQYLNVPINQKALQDHDQFHKKFSQTDAGNCAEISFSHQSLPVLQVFSFLSRHYSDSLDFRSLFEKQDHSHILCFPNNPEEASVIALE